MLSTTPIHSLCMLPMHLVIGQSAVCRPCRCCSFVANPPSIIDHVHALLSAACRQLQLAVQAKRRGGWNDSSSRGRGSSKDDKSFRFKFNQIDVSLAEDQLWRLALPFAALFGLAVFIGEFDCSGMCYAVWLYWRRACAARGGCWHSSVSHISV
jgi:hypothetical protein